MNRNKLFLALILALTCGLPARAQFGGHSGMGGHSGFGGGRAAISPPTCVQGGNTDGTNCSNSADNRFNLGNQSSPISVSLNSGVNVTAGLESEEPASVKLASRVADGIYTLDYFYMKPIHMPIRVKFGAFVPV